MQDKQRQKDAHHTCPWTSVVLIRPSQWMLCASARLLLLHCSTLCHLTLNSCVCAQRLCRLVHVWLWLAEGLPGQACCVGRGSASPVTHTTPRGLQAGHTKTRNCSAVLCCCLLVHHTVPHSIHARCGMISQDDTAQHSTAHSYVAAAFRDRSLGLSKKKHRELTDRQAHTQQIGSQTELREKPHSNQ